MTTPEHIPPPSPSVSYGSPGAAIRAGRKRAGMSLEELASMTRLAKPTLEAMEADAFDQLLEPVYVRGYYRKCARILELAEEPLIEAYEAMYTPPPKPAPPARLRLASGELGTSSHTSRRFVALAALAAVVFGVVIWMLSDTAPTHVGSGGSTVTMIDPLSGETIRSDTMPPVDPPASTAPASEAPVSSGTESPASAAGGDAAAVTPAPSAPAESEPAAATEPAPEPKPVGTQLVLVFEAISWARIEDSNGKSLLSGVIPAGERRELDGKPPYSVFLGNAPGVKVEFGGMPVDSSPYVKSNSTARFSVPLAGG